MTKKNKIDMAYQQAMETQPSYIGQNIKQYSRSGPGRHLHTKLLSSWLPSKAISGQRQIIQTRICKSLRACPAALPEQRKVHGGVKGDRQANGRSRERIGSSRVLPHREATPGKCRAQAALKAPYAAAFCRTVVSAAPALELVLHGCPPLRLDLRLYS